MVTQIILGVVGLAFVVLVVFLVRTLISLRKTLKRVDRVLHDAHKALEPTTDLINSVNRLTGDIRKKSEGIDVLFRPLYAMKKDSHHHEKHGQDRMAEIMDCISDGVRLFMKVKDEVSDYVKSK